ncbi:DPH3 homolog [Copidosoma floridanum]|uniref:DPH3 homolog n=1 Tax=Copidosoma floridanum TaxID=29053 RepID=UPI0006C9456B|nr:DPH3 homolog [Copidosoma floridanum]
MTTYHDEVELEDFEYDEDDGLYYYPCPCGDQFQISREELVAGEDEATCPSCSLVVKVIYDVDKFKEKYGEVIEEKDLDDFEYDEDAEVYSYPCSCSDRYLAKKSDILVGKTEAKCSSCDLSVKLTYDKDSLCTKFEEVVKISEKKTIKQHL